jgi:hypothetical protein
VNDNERRSLLSEIEAKELLHDAGIPVARTVLATTEDEAKARAEELGYPVVLKIVSPDITHKSDIGGVKVGLNDADAVVSAFAEIMANAAKAAPDAAVSGVAVQQMAPDGTEVIVGMTTDPQFGPVVMFGLGGILVEVMKDVSFRIVPLEERDAAQISPGQSCRSPSSWSRIPASGNLISIRCSSTRMGRSPSMPGSSSPIERSRLSAPDRSPPLIRRSRAHLE